MTAGTANHAAAGWREERGRGVTVVAPAGTYAARRVLEELRAAERVLAEAQALLQPSSGAQTTITIYLTDPIVGTSDDQASPAVSHAAAIVRVVEPERPGRPVAWPLVRFLIGNWFGEAATSATLIVNGVAGVIAARTETGPSLVEADEWVRTELEAGRPVSIFGPADQTIDDRAATSFAGFLVRTCGAEALHQFFTLYDVERRDHAAATAFHRPLGALEEAWLAGLRRTARGESPFRALFRQLRPLIRPHLGRQIESFAYMLIGALLGLAVPLAGKYLVDNVIPSGSKRRLVYFVFAVLIIYGANALVDVRRNYVVAVLNQRILMDLQVRMFSHLQRLPHSFYARAKVGDLMSRLSTDLQAVQSAIATFIGFGIFLALSAVAAAVTLLVLSPLLGLLVIVVVPIFAASYLILEERYSAASREYQRLTGEVTSIAQENLSAQSVIKAFSLAHRAVATYRARRQAALNAILRLVVVGSIFDVSISLATTLGQVVVLGVGGYLVIEGRLTIGTLLAFIGLLPSLFQPVAALSGVAQTVQRAAGALERVNELLDEPTTIADRPDVAALPPVSRGIRFDRLSFGYEPGRPILRDLNFTIPAGDNVAFVGASGSGKSTVVNLLLRFFDPDQGQVLFDGRDLRDVTLDSLRQQIGLVFQDTFVFDSTVRENIAIGRPEATDAEVAQAARAARLTDYIASLPAGYDTVLGERGVRMSGGQRQRLAIARALIRNPRVLILDEATSALDAVTEAEIQQTLAEVARDRTTISITHRLTSLEALDQIYVLDQGRLVEQGSHAELLAAGGLYRRLYEEQTGAARIGPRRLTEEVERLRTVPLFAELSQDLLVDLAGYLTLERVGAGVDVVRQGEPADRLILMVQGQVEVVVGTSENERRINTLTGGDYFGEMALLTDQPRSATVRTLIPTQLYSLGRAEFLTLLERAPSLRDAVNQTMARRRAALDAAASAANPTSALETA
jgi:ABC-type multidrug transport system fused ATPase/permease subunit